MAAYQRLIDANEAKKRLRAVHDWFCGYPGTEQDKLARAVAKMCIKELDKVKPADAVEVPCKMGDEVWGLKIYKGNRFAKKGVVHQMYFGDDMRLCICVKGVCRGEWGKTVFATDKEAYAAIEERRTNERKAD